MNDFKLVGYSSDDLHYENGKPIVNNDIPKNRIIYNGNQNSNRLGKPIKSKKQKREERANGLFSKVEPLELDEWFVYSVDGEKWYYKHAQDLNVLKMHHVAEFLGIGRPNGPIKKEIKRDTGDGLGFEGPIYKIITPVFNKTKNIIKVTKPTQSQVAKFTKWHGTFCCYCEIALRPETFTRDHIIPRSKGGGAGKNLKPCCKVCNTEKADLLLREYIVFLNILFVNASTGTPYYKLLQTKIRNANEIAKSLDINN